jgi:hypothetical protein
MSIWFLPQARATFSDSSSPEGYISLNSLTLTSFERITQAGEIKALLYKHYPDDSPETIETMTQSLWQFSHEIQPEDIALLWDKTDTHIFLCEITGQYHFNKQNSDTSEHTYPARLIKTIAPTQLKNGNLLTHRKRWCVAIEDSPLATEIKDLLRVGKRFSQRVIVMYALLFIAFQLFMMWNIYWKFATSHQVID